MKNYFKTGSRSRVPQLRCYNFIQTTVAIEVQIADSSLKVHGKNQTHQTEVMIAVQVAYEDMVYTMEINLQAHELHLCALATIYHEMTALHFHKLRSRMPSIGRQRTT